MSSRELVAGSSLFFIYFLDTVVGPRYDNNSLFLDSRFRGNDIRTHHNISFE
ncbi:MAG: palindromic element RPE4 domain-containing protein [Rickettsia endosymbiont of Eriopis connexa]|nr:palindromic element RPE4 domain-containing protein [Rickettsia endosymbiont of Eriopis connexa]